MPVQSCSIDGKPGFRWGDAGKCYTYTPGDSASRDDAREKARNQGLAIGEQLKMVMTASALGHVNITFMSESIGDLALEPNVDAEDEDKNKNKKRRDAVQNDSMGRAAERLQKRKQGKNKGKIGGGCVKGLIIT
jgi:hypothetical protein